METELELAAETETRRALTLGRAAPRLHVALKKVVCTEQLAGFICSTFSDPEKLPGSLLALPAQMYLLLLL